MKLVRPKRKVKQPESYSPEVVIDSAIHIDVSAFTADQIAALKDSLTFENPAYGSAMRYSPYGYTNIPKFISYYNTSMILGKKTLDVPVGTDLSILGSFHLEDCRLERPVKKQKFVHELRPDQKVADINYITYNKNSKQPKGIIQLPTGKGKTWLAIHIACELSQKTLVIVHKDDLVNSWTEAVKECCPDCGTVGLIKAQKRVIGDFITIATVQTLNRLNEEDFNELTSSFGFVIVDEGHHAPSSSFEILNHFPAKYRLALTATPERKDGLIHVMKLYFGDFCYTYVPSKDEKDILPCEVFQREFRFCINPLCALSHKGRWIIKDLRCDPRKYKLQEGECFISDLPYEVRPKIVYSDYSNLIARMSFRGIANDVMNEYAQGHSCIVFFSQKEQIEDFRDRLVDEGVNPAHILTYYGNNSNKMNEYNKLQASGNRQRITLCTYSKATEGTDVRQWECAFLVGSLNDAKNVEQAVGRIRRIMRDPDRKLAVARVYDYSYPNVYSIRSHWRTRLQRYLKLGFTVHALPTPNPEEVKSAVKENTEPPKRKMLKKKGLFSKGFSISRGIKR